MEGGERMSAESAVQRGRTCKLALGSGLKASSPFSCGILFGGPHYNVCSVVGLYRGLLYMEIPIVDVTGIWNIPELWWPESDTSAASWPSGNSG